jgi:hypothetical protein
MSSTSMMIGGELVSLRWLGMSGKPSPASLAAKVEISID